jgi:glycosyltransferase involved in cell wall biosynthesis
MENRYPITVLIPCHSLLYLPQSIESINLQTFPKKDFEVLLVADRLEVSAAEKILKGSGLNYRIIQSTEPGIVPALNLGLKNITSEFIARMDEDDVMFPERLQLQFEYLKKHKSVLAVGGQLALIDIENRIIGLTSYHTRIKLSNRHLFESSPVAHPAVMFRREIVNHIGGYRSFLPEDWDLWVRLRQIGPIHNLRERVLNYRVHAGQLSREKMYAQAIGKQFVSTSYFARQESIRDYPEIHEDPSLWLEKTKSELRKTSRDFRKFEWHSEKVEMINSVLQLHLKKALIKEILSVFLDYPVFTVKYLAMRVIRKLKLKSYKSV